MAKGERVLLALFAIFMAAIAAYVAFYAFLEEGVEPNVAAGLTVVIIIAILGAFGVIAVRARI